MESDDPHYTLTSKYIIFNWLQVRIYQQNVMYCQCILALRWMVPSQNKTMHQERMANTGVIYFMYSLCTHTKQIEMTCNLYFPQHSYLAGYGLSYKTRCSFLLIMRPSNEGVFLLQFISKAMSRIGRAQASCAKDLRSQDEVCSCSHHSIHLAS